MLSRLRSVVRCASLFIGEVSSRRTTMQRGTLQMGKNPLRQEQKMFDAGAIDLAPERRIEQARKWVLALWDRVAALPGENQESAMHRAARLANISAGMVWSFRYRMPKKLDVAAYFSIKAAYERHVASVEASLANNLLILRSLPADPRRDRLVAQMEEFLGHPEGSEGRPAAEADAEFDQRQGWGR